MSIANQPLLVRVKRRRQDASPEDLFIEAQSGSSVSPCLDPDPVQSLAALTMDECQAPPKRRKFQLVTTVDDAHAGSTDDLLSKLQSRNVTQDMGLQAAANLNRVDGSVKVAGAYRQIRTSQAEEDAVQQSFKLYDLVYEAAGLARNQLFRTTCSNITSSSRS